MYIKIYASKIKKYNLQECKRESSEQICELGLVRRIGVWQKRKVRHSRKGVNGIYGYSHREGVDDWFVCRLIPTQMHNIVWNFYELV